MPSPDTSGACWRRSSRTDNGNGNCVELAALEAHTAIRDSKDPDGGTLALRPSGWHGLLAAAKSRARERRQEC